MLVIGSKKTDIISNTCQIENHILHYYYSTYRAGGKREQEETKTSSIDRVILPPNSGYAIIMDVNVVPIYIYIHSHKNYIKA